MFVQTKKIKYSLFIPYFSQVMKSFNAIPCRTNQNTLHWAHCSHNAAIARNFIILLVHTKIMERVWTSWDMVVVFQGSRIVNYFKLKSSVSACTYRVYTRQLNRYSIYLRTRSLCTSLASTVKVGHFVLQTTVWWYTI